MKSFSKAILMVALLSVGPAAAELVEETESISGKYEIPLERPVLEGHRGGNGGNSIGSQFNLIAKNSAKAWRAMCGEEPVPMCQHLEQFESLLDRESPNFVTVLASPTVYADDGQEREAVNFFGNQGRGTIVVSQKAWSEMDSHIYKAPERKINLVLHEYFSIMGIESSDFYDFSRDLYTFFVHTGYDTEKIASNEAMPSACSINFKGSEDIAPGLNGSIKSHLSQLGYESVDNSKSARFSMKIRLSCSTNALFNHSCSVYTEVVDTFKGDFIHFDEHVTGQRFIRKKNLINDLHQEALSQLKPCN
tara:strand:- start:233641 stop:234558 length:918 start_codon:yes stop_codon:yes gene_type:complete